MARRILETGRPGDQAYHEAASDFDFWLRADGHRRNPGTTADLITAGLFVALREAIIELPLRFYAS
jgi:triphosphoribosyl-dephospho-CoA synthase